MFVCMCVCVFVSMQIWVCVCVCVSTLAWTLNRSRPAGHYVRWPAVCFCLCCVSYLSCVCSRGLVAPLITD